MDKMKECWRQFSTPMIRDGDHNMEILDFECPITHHAFSVYYSKSEPVNAELLSQVMNSALSSCFHCTQSSFDYYNMDNEQSSILTY